MLKGLFPRLFGQYKEGGLVVGKWTIGASGAPTKVDAETHNNLSLARDNTGTYTLTLAGGAVKMHVLDLRVVNPADATDVTDFYRAELDADISNGAVSFVTITGDGTEAINDAISGSRIHAALYISK